MSLPRGKFVLLILVVFGSMAGLMVIGMRGDEGLLYYYTVEEFQGEPARQEKDFRVNGKVVEGSIERFDSGEDVRFTMKDESTAMTVSYHGIIPDTFVDRADVVVEGRLTSEGVFKAHKLLAKCPSKYENADGEESNMETGSGEDAI